MYQIFIKMKIENSGKMNQQQCDEVNEYHAKLGFNFKIKPEDTGYNPGLRQVAKICLNSLWGKFGQRSTMTEYDFYYDYNALIKKFINSEIIPQTWNIIDTNCVELRYLENEDTIIETDYISEITAVFTTANARVRLYKMMDWLDPSQVAYCDTDSVIFKYDADNPKHKDPYKNEDIEDAKLKGLEFGTGLGQWEDEFKGKDYITELVIGGAKSYAYKTASGKIVIKQKGITLSRDNDTVVNFEAFKKMVLNNSK